MPAVEGGLTYFGGAERVLCNRCAQEVNVFHAVRVGWTAVEWGCLTMNERMAHSKHVVPLTLVPREWVIASMQAEPSDTKKGEPDDEE